MAFVHIQHYGVRHSFLSRLPTTVRSLRLKAYIGEKVVHLPPRYTVALLTKLCGREKLPLGWRFKLNLGKLKRRIAGLLSHDLIERKRLLITDDTCRIEDGDRHTGDVEKLLRSSLTKRFFHPVELGNVGFLKPHGLGRRVRHSYHREAVFGHEVHWPGFTLFIEIFSQSKIGCAKQFRTFSSSLANISHNMGMLFTKCLGQLLRSDRRNLLVVDEFELDN